MLIWPKNRHFKTMFIRFLLFRLVKCNRHENNIFLCQFRPFRAIWPTKIAILKSSSIDSADFLSFNQIQSTKGKRIISQLNFQLNLNYRSAGPVVQRMQRQKKKSGEIETSAPLTELHSNNNNNTTGKKKK